MVALVIVAIAAVIFASGTKPSAVGSGDAPGDRSRAPRLEAEGWINSTPLTPAALAHKVVLYDFWTYSCVNCVRTIPYLRAWYDRYHRDGLVIVGVHSPEFDFEKNHANVRRAVKELKVDYPVALDDDMRIWNAFANQYWPADFLYDRSGRQAATHIGEGGYAGTERRIRQLLGVASGSPHAVVGKTNGTPGAAGVTPETYNGSARGQIGFVSPQFLDNGTRTYTAPFDIPRDAHALVGAWTVTPEYIESAAPGAAIVLRYHAAEANLVMATTGGPVAITVQVDDRTPTTMTVTDADLYRLVQDPAAGTHTLRLTATAPGLRAYAFTFGGAG
jgi:thiol-disulfide isomerase/thioredoxin